MGGKAMLEFLFQCGLETLYSTSDRAKNAVGVAVAQQNASALQSFMEKGLIRGANPLLGNMGCLLARQLTRLQIWPLTNPKTQTSLLPLIKRWTRKRIGKADLNGGRY